MSGIRRVIKVIALLLSRLFQESSEEFSLLAAFYDVLTAVDVFDQIGDDCDAALADSQVEEAHVRLQRVLCARHRDGFGDVSGLDEDDRVGPFQRGRTLLDHNLETGEIGVLILCQSLGFLDLNVFQAKSKFLVTALPLRLEILL